MVWLHEVNEQQQPEAGRMIGRKVFLLYEKGTLTFFVEQRGHVRGKVPMSPSLIGAHHSALFLSHYGRSRMLG